MDAPSTQANQSPDSTVSPSAVLVHLSDFHFVEKLTEEGRRLWTKRFVKSHSFAKIDGLSLQFGDFRRREKPIDVFIITGDLSTDGSRESLETALTFIEENEIHLGTPKRFKCMGLQAKAAARIVLPGNHDRYGGGWVLPKQGMSDTLEQVFGISKSYPYVLGHETHGGLQLLFFVFDSTLPSSSNAHFWERVARGWVEKGECDWLRRQPNDLRNGRVPTLDGHLANVRYDQALRVALLHHHPVKVKGRDSLTSLYNNEDFVAACFEAKIDLVLFGHEHVEYWHSEERNGHFVHFLCCPSASEFTSTNGFYVINVYGRAKRIEREVYEWNDNVKGFTKAQGPRVGEEEDIGITAVKAASSQTTWRLKP